MAKENLKEKSEEKSSKEEKVSKDEESSEEDELAKLEDELKAKEEVILELTSHIQRLQADFDNFRKQTEKHNRNLVEFANEGLILKFIDSYEDMGRVLENSKTKEDLEEGFKLIYSKMQNTLENEGLKEIPTVGEKFDPFVHEAQGTINSPNHEDKEIVAEIMKGYSLKDKIIKNPIVIVCKK